MGVHRKEKQVALKTYRELEAWEASMQLAEKAYELTKRLPEAEKFGLISQLRRAAISVPANIAEGYGRVHRGDYLHHLSIAKGSLAEVETLLTLCVRLKMIDRAKMMPTWNQAQTAGKLLAALLRSLRNPKPQTPDPV